jgi:hypothetical protein
LLAFALLVWLAARAALATTARLWDRNQPWK